MTRPSLSVVVPTHDTREMTLRCLGSLADGGVAPLEVIVVDDDSGDGTAQAVRAEAPSVEVVATGENVGFTRAANLGVERTTGDLILLLNSDTEVLEGSLAALAAGFSDDQTLGVGGAELLDPDGTAQWRAGRRPGLLWLFAQASGLGARASRWPGRGLMGAAGAGRSGTVDWVTGAALAVRRSVWQDCGPFDERYRFYCQDLDLCVAAGDAGWSVQVVPGFRVMHHHGATISGETGGASISFHPGLLWTDLMRFTTKHGGRAAGRRAAFALAAGARLRLLRLAATSRLAGGEQAARLRHERQVYRDGLARIAHECEVLSDAQR